MKKLRIIILVLSLLAFLSTSIGGYFYYLNLQSSIDKESRREASEILSNITRDINFELNKHQKSVTALAGQPWVRQALINTNSRTIESANIILDSFQDALDASVCYLMDGSGKTIASSNRNSPKSFIGKSYAFRPYFKQSIKGSLYTYMALGVTSRARGAYYSYPVYGDNSSFPLGVVVVKQSIKGIEDKINQVKIGHVLVTGPQGIVFISSNKEWLYQSLWKLSTEEISAINKSRQFGKGPRGWTGLDVRGKKLVTDSSGRDYNVHLSAINNYPGWNIYFLIDHTAIVDMISSRFSMIFAYVILTISIFTIFIIVLLYKMADYDVRQKQRAKHRIDRLNNLKEHLLGPYSLDEKLKRITYEIVSMFDADFSRIWITRQGDLCDSGCFHSEARDELHSCKRREYCLHLKASSGRYTHINGKVHQRVPYGCYKIGLIASGKTPRFITNDVRHDPNVHDNKWAANLGLASFAGYRLLSDSNKPVGVLAVFSKHKISPDEDAMLENLANTTAQVIQTAKAEEALQQAHDELEDRVKERTGELEKANVDLKALDRMKSMFIATMSHELRTPLNAIIGFTSTVLEGIAGDINPEQKDHLSRVENASQHLLEMVNDIIDISEIEAGTIEILKSTFMLNDLIKEAVNHIHPKLLKEGIALDMAAPPELEMYTDRKRLLQCIINLLSNAAKFTEAGKINISARDINGTIKIAVTDTGIGIAEDDLPRIFAPFVRLQSRLTVKAGGTGLGLYLTKKLATEILQGTIEVDSTESKGSTFRLRIPKKID